MGVQMHLNQLFNKLDVEELEYEPETSPMLKFKMNKDGPTIMVFSSGNYFLAGASSVREAKEAYRNMVYNIKQLSINLNSPYFEVRNVVCRIDFKREFELSELCIELGLENCEYNPDQSPALLCRLPGCEGVFLIFRTGIVLSTGAGSIDEIVADINSLVQTFNEINVNFDNEVTDIGAKLELEV